MACIVDNRRFYCTTSDTYFGPVFRTDDDGEGFMGWLSADPRTYANDELVTLYTDYARLPK